MATCDYCETDTNIIFICSRCKEHFCSTHSSPEKHDCSSIQKPDKSLPSADNNTESSEIPYINKAPKIVLKKEDIPPTEKRSDQSSKDNEEGILEESFQEDKLERRKKEEEKEKTDNKGLNNKIMSVLLIVSLVANGLLYLEYKNYSELRVNYIELFNITQTLRTYYDNLTRQHSEVREEYIQLNSLYSDLVKSNSELTKEYKDIINYRKKMQLASRQTITLLPKENHAITYDIPFSGYITVNYTASGEAYVWVGSTSLETNYYSRNPQFPDTASDLHFIIPVQPDLLVYFANPNEFDSVEIIYWISFTY